MTTHRSLRASHEEIRRAIHAIYVPGDTYEVRAPKARFGTTSGYFSDLQALARAVQQVDGKAPGVYITLNPVKPELLARANNRLKERATETTSDADILCRRWMLVDIDAKRAAGISSSDQEHEAALQLAIEVREGLSTLSWPEPIYADSGNGAHLLYRLPDLPNTVESTDLVRRCLQALSARFGDPCIQVDETVFNASRISKAYGTVARKGDSTPERPHRLARVLECPAAIVPVSKELLRAFADTAPKPAAPPKSAPRSTPRSSFDPDAWIRQHLSVRSGPDPYQNGRKWVLERCVFNPEHKAPDACVIQHGDGMIVYRCLHNSCRDHTWPEVRERFEPGYRERRERAQQQGAPRPSTEPPPSPVPPGEESRTLPIDQLPGTAELDALLKSGDPRKFIDQGVNLLAALPEEAEEGYIVSASMEFGAAISKQRLRNLVKAKRRNLIVVEGGRSDSNWRDKLITSDKGPRALLANAIAAFRHAPEWSGVLWFNEFANETIARGETPWGKTGKWTDRDDVLAAEWLQQQGIHISAETTGQAIEAVARDQHYHPVREYLDSLVWDGEQRIDQWLTTYLGVELTPYSSAVGRRWLISAVARANQPGCKADCSLILEGPQGLLKSSAVKTIAGEFFTDDLDEMGSKDAAMQIQGVWIVEIAELDSMSRTDVGKIKAFLSRTTDRFRPPYGKRLVESKRQCVFAGTVNHSTYLRDDTGNRRFWPVTCSRIDIQALREDRDQLWAEAVATYRDGAVWWLNTQSLTAAAAQEQAERVIEDPWEEPVMNWIEKRESDLEGVSSEDVLEYAIGKKRDQWTQTDKNRVAACLKRAGWQRHCVGPRGARSWRYLSPKAYAQRAQDQLKLRSAEREES